jgi:hypothetical protein
MNWPRMGAILLIVAGTLGLVYRQFVYDRSVQRTAIGPIGFSVTERQTVDVPVWASVGAIVAGSVLLLAGRRRANT